MITASLGEAPRHWVGVKRLLCLLPPPLHPVDAEPEPFFSPLLQGFTSGSSASICLLLSVCLSAIGIISAAAATRPNARLAKRTPGVELTAEDEAADAVKLWHKGRDETVGGFSTGGQRAVINDV